MSAQSSSTTTAPLIPIAIASTYASGGQPIALPARLALATPDTAAAIAALAAAVTARGGTLRLSDLYRSRAAQEIAHRDWVRGAKTAYSPPAGGSMHEAGRAFDLDLAAVAMPLAELWTLARPLGLVPIIETPDSRLSEAWHLECRGSHQLVHDHYARGRARNVAPAQAMAISAILATGVTVDRFAANQTAAAMQGALIRLGHDIGAIDGRIGPRTLSALASRGLGRASETDRTVALAASLRARFPSEWAQAEDGPVPSVVSNR